RVQQLVLRPRGDRAEVRRFALRRDGEGWAAGVPGPNVQVELQGNPLDPEYQQRMEQYGREMEEWSRKYGERYSKQWERWGEQFGKRMEHWGKRQGEWGKRQGELAQRLAIAPRVV